MKGPEEDRQDMPAFIRAWTCPDYKAAPKESPGREFPGLLLFPEDLDFHIPVFFLKELIDRDDNRKNH